MNVRVFKKTTDEWYGNYKVVSDPWAVNLVEVSFMDLVGGFLVCVWGNDDSGMEFISDDEVIAWNVFLQIIGKKDVLRKDMLALGLVGA